MPEKITAFDELIRTQLAAILCNKTSELLTTLPEHNIDQVIAICEQEGITALLRYHLQQTKQLDALPEKLQNRLKQIELQSVATQLARQHENTHLIQLFKKNNLEFILMKGEALAQSIYPSPHHRTRCDSDFLFQGKEQTEQVWLVLQEEGYQRIATMEGKFVGFQYACTKMLPSGVRMELDIHNQINNYLWFTQRLSFGELMANATQLNYQGQMINILSPTYALIHACVHRITNKSKGLENRLIWLYDIHLLAPKLPNTEWKTLYKIAEAKNLAAILLQALDVSQKTLNTQLTDKSLQPLRILAEQQTENFEGGSRRIHIYLKDFFQNKGVTNKLQHLWERLFPPTNYIMYKYNLQRKTALPYYYIKRIIDVIFRK